MRRLYCLGALLGTLVEEVSGDVEDVAIGTVCRSQRSKLIGVKCMGWLIGEFAFERDWSRLLRDKM